MRLFWTENSLLWWSAALFLAMAAAGREAASPYSASSTEQQPAADYAYSYYDEDAYYYDDRATASDQPPEAVLAGETTSSEGKKPDSSAADSVDSSQYDLDELVKAWKEYMKEKGQQSSADLPPPRRRRPRPRPRPRPHGGLRRRPAFNDYSYYYYQDERPLRRDPSSPLRHRPSIQLTNDKEEDYECPPRDQSYQTPDPEQCDKFYECNIKGEQKELLCPDGFMFVISAQRCDYPSKVNCTGRPKLQEAKASKNCPRQNGFFPWPAEESCQKFWDCREGKSYLQECPQGVIFDPKVDSCVTPDQSARTQCGAGKVLGFECPKYDSDALLRFGNHDRLAHPTDCQQFFTCLRTGQPRLGSCPRNQVFNEPTGHCDDPANVKGCENYWKDREKDDLEDYYSY